jgi:hypothetical protein
MGIAAFFTKRLIKNGGAMRTVVMVMVMAMTRLDLSVGQRLIRLTHWTARITLVVCAASLGAPFSWAVAEQESDIRETGRLVAVLLDSGRVVIGRNQQLINDPDKGDKCFTPEVFAQQTMALFEGTDRT